MEKAAALGKYFISVFHLKAASKMQEYKKIFYKPPKGGVSQFEISFFLPELAW